MHKADGIGFQVYRKINFPNLMRASCHYSLFISLQRTPNLKESFFFPSENYTILSPQYYKMMREVPGKYKTLRNWMCSGRLADLEIGKTPGIRPELSENLETLENFD